MINEGLNPFDLRKDFSEKTITEEWYDRAEKALTIPKNLLKEPNWFKNNWNPSWGDLIPVKMTENGKESIYFGWKRPDGGGEIAISNDEENSIKAVRFALLGAFISLVRQTGGLTFIKPGCPPNWRNFTVFLNEKPATHMLNADALLNRCQKIATNEYGKPIYKDKDGAYEIVTLHNVVIDIRPEAKIEPFF